MKGATQTVTNISEPCVITVITSTLLGIKKRRKNKGVNKNLISLLHEDADAKSCQ